MANPIVLAARAAPLAAGAIAASPAIPVMIAATGCIVVIMGASWAFNRKVKINRQTGEFAIDEI